jgi:hypothetical protein
MIVEIAIPELTLYPDGFPSRWLGIIFFGNRRDEYKIHAIITTYIRLVEGAYVHYKNARQRAQAFWNNHASVDMFSHNLSATYFEDCINSMHRAILCMKRIHSYPEVPADLKNLFPKEPQFTADAVADRIREVMPFGLKKFGYDHMHRHRSPDHICERHAHSNVGFDFVPSNVVIA